jgi:hypothetical protein
MEMWWLTRNCVLLYVVVHIVPLKLLYFFFCISIRSFRKRRHIALWLFLPIVPRNKTAFVDSVITQALDFLPLVVYALQENLHIPLVLAIYQLGCPLYIPNLTVSAPVKSKST